MQYIYIISKNNISLDEIYTQISYAIDTQKFNDLVQVVQQFVYLYSRQSAQVYKTIFSNKVNANRFFFFFFANLKQNNVFYVVLIIFKKLKFGLTYLLKFVSKSELINQDDYDMDVKSIWLA